MDRRKFKYILLKRGHLRNGELTVSSKQLKKIPVEDKEQEDPNLVGEFTNCELCGRSDREETLLLCDGCDRGFHCECLRPRLYRIPDGLWFCPTCQDIRGMPNQEESTIDTSVIEEVIARSSRHTEQTRTVQSRTFRRRPMTRRKRRKVRRRKTKKTKTTTTTSSKTAATRKRIVSKYRRRKVSLRSRRKAAKKKAIALAAKKDPKTRILNRMMEIKNERREETRPSTSNATQTSILSEQTFGKDRAEAAKYHKDPFDRLKVEDTWFNSKSIFYEVEVKE